jgi:hypothetical protein
MNAMMLEFSTNSLDGWNTCSSAIADSSFGEPLLRIDYVLRNRPAETVADVSLPPDGEYIREDTGVKKAAGLANTPKR